MNILVIFFVGFIFGKYIETIIDNLTQTINLTLGVICMKLKYCMEETQWKIENIGKNQKPKIGFMSDEDDNT